jgi:hypothetical protein
MVEAMAIPGMGATLKTVRKIKTPARVIKPASTLLFIIYSKNIVYLHKYAGTQK